MLYTDGSCHTQLRIGAWATILFYNNQKYILSGVINHTSHQRMELMAVIAGLEYVQLHFPAIKQVKIISDSQYVIGLAERQHKLTAADFKTKAMLPISNDDLVKQLFGLSNLIAIEFVKIKAHQKQQATHNYNIDADKLCRKLVREAVKKN